jgi:BRCT domain type II-containing protein
MFQPTKTALPLEDFKNAVFGSTGFPDYDKAWVERLVGLLGGTFTQTFSRKNSHLICNPSYKIGSAKVEKAREWNIPVVDVEWLYKSIDLGRAAILNSGSQSSVTSTNSLKLSLRTTKASQMMQKTSLKNTKGKFVMC